MTIAFSTESLEWTTKYSFEADEYGVVDNQMVGFPAGKSSIAWVHDKTESYNTFYGESYPSVIEVVTNENPSAGKIYEAFSVESTSGDWSGQFTTETGETQTSSFPAGSLVEKEGKHYIDVPKNSLNKSIGLKYVGQTTIGALRAADSDLVAGEYNAEIQMSGRIVSVPNAYLAFSLPNELSTEQAELVTAAGGTEALLEYLSLPNEARVYEPLLGSSSFYSVDQFDPNSDSLEYYEMLQPRFNASTNSIEMAYFDFDVFDQAFFLAGNTAFDSVPLAVYTTSSSTELNGEDMRGEYMRVRISKEGTDYYELYCINIDQHKTKLDHSLGQNN